ncbi:tail protein [Ferriphaselus amnicola]|uniref:Tail protein n=1 Tax=Ferriphaselus amnicola TaxID=1188319 RepID=A0A2Z6GCT7_9PROT|nr:tail protein X [Ferriphaselus amnicola]BBE51132.1 tail protein [Ferriphaselus amnicola]
MQVIALQGDTLDALCWRHLGTTAGVTEQALELNPGLAAHGPILPMGLTVTLPDQVQTHTNNTHLNLWD